MFRRLAILIIGGGLLIPLTACKPAPPIAQNLTRNPYLAYCANTGDIGCMQQIVAQVWGGQAGLVDCIITHESNWDRGARNPSGASGLLQIELPIHDDMFAAAGYAPGEYWWTDVYANIEASWFLSNFGRDMQPWTPDCGI